MDEIIRAAAQRTGFSEDQARQAVEATIGLLKERLPEPARSMLVQFVGSQGESATSGEEAVGEAAQQPSMIDQAAEAVKNIFNR